MPYFQPRAILVAIFAFGAAVSCAQSETPMAEFPDAGADMSEADMSGTDTGGGDVGVEDGGSSDDMGAPDTAHGPTRIVPGVPGEQSLGSERYRMGVSAGATGGAARESEQYRLRLGAQPHLVRPAAKPATGDQ